jgi:hypothetical protein
MATLPISKFGENLPVTGIGALSQVAVGFGVGLLVADKMEMTTRQRTAIVLIGAGVAAVIPLLPSAACSAGSSRSAKTSASRPKKRWLEPRPRPGVPFAPAA